MITLVQHRELSIRLSQVSQIVSDTKTRCGVADAGPLNDAVEDLANAVDILRIAVRDLLTTQELKS